MDLGKRIKQFREALKLNQRQLAESCANIDTRDKATKWGQSRIANYETNTRTPDLEDIKVLAAVLKVEPSDLAFGDTELEYAGKAQAGLVRVIGEAMLGRNTDTFEMLEDFFGYLRIYSTDPEAFALKVRGSSMEPRIYSGEYVLIEPNTRPSMNDEVFVRTVDGQNMIKILAYHRDGEYRFLSVNNEHKPFNLQENEVEQVLFVAGILKESRFIDKDML